MSGDSRKDFILSSIGNFFGYSRQDGAISHIQDSRELNTFLDDGNTMLLVLYPELVDEVKLIQSSNQISTDSESAQFLIFFKIQPTTINPDNLHTNIIISSLIGSPISTLYHSVQKIFAPVLLKDIKWSKSIDPKLQILLTELEAGLGSSLRNLQPSAEARREKTEKGDENLYSILTLADELQYWAEMAVSSKQLAARERAMYFQELLQQIVSDFSNLDALSFSECLELIEDAQDVLDDLWKQSEHHPPYEQTRMSHILEVISGTLGRYVQRKLADLDVWEKHFGHVRSSIQDGLGVWEKWTSATDILTSHFWRAYQLHQWKGGTFCSPTLSMLIRRLEEVLHIRSLHEQLLQLLSPSEIQEFNLPHAFSPFSGQ